MITPDDVIKLLVASELSHAALNLQGATGSKKARAIAARNLNEALEPFRRDIREQGKTLPDAAPVSPETP